MGFGQTLGDRESQAQAAEPPANRRIALLEREKNPRQRPCFNTHTTVGNFHDKIIIRRAGGRDPDRAFDGGELDRVAGQVGDDPVKFCAIYSDVTKLRPEIDAQIYSLGFEFAR